MPTLVTPQKLREVVEASIDKRRDAVELGDQAYMEFRGRFHGDGGDGIKRHLNLVNRSVGVLRAHLASFNPLHDVESDWLTDHAEATLAGMYLDRLAVKLDRRRLSRMCILDALLRSRAVVRCGLKDGADLVKIQGRLYDPGQFYARKVPDRWHVMDPTATTQEGLQWEGDFYPVNRASLLECGLFNPAVIERLPGMADDPDQGIVTPSRPRDSVRDRVRRYSLTDQVLLLDVALYDANGECFIVTMPADMDYDGDFLRIEEFRGPNRGPYEWLVLGAEADDDIEALAPVSQWREAGEAFYTVVGKWIEQIQRTKRILTAGRNVADDDLDLIRVAEDGEVLHVDDVKELAMQEFGGTSPDFPAVIAALQMWSNQAAHNADLLGGAGADTDKATIFKGLQANANVQLHDYRGGVEDFEGRISTHAAWHGLSDPRMGRLPMIHTMPGGEKIQVHYTPDQKKIENFRYRCRPKSTISRDPETQLVGLMKMLEIILKAAEVSMSTGGFVDVAAVAREGGKLLQLDNLEYIIRDQILVMEKAMAAQNMGPPGRGVPMGPTPGLNMDAASYNFRLDGQGGSGGGNTTGRRNQMAGQRGRPALSQGPAAGRRQPMAAGA